MISAFLAATCNANKLWCRWWGIDGGAGGAAVNPQVDGAQDAGGAGYESPADGVGGTGQEGLLWSSKSSFKDCGSWPARLCPCAAPRGQTASKKRANSSG